METKQFAPWRGMTLVRRLLGAGLIAGMLALAACGGGGEEATNGSPGAGAPLTPSNPQVPQVPPVTNPGTPARPA